MSLMIAGPSLSLFSFDWSELPQVLDVLNSCPESTMYQYGVRQLTEEHLRQEITETSQIPSGMWITLHDREQLIGIAYILVQSPYDAKSWIGTLVIHADWQRHGYGTEAVQLLESYLHSNHISSLHVGIVAEHDTALRFFGRLGYEQYRQVETTVGSHTWPVLLLGKFL